MNRRLHFTTLTTFHSITSAMAPADVDLDYTGHSRWEEIYRWCKSPFTHPHTYIYIVYHIAHTMTEPGSMGPPPSHPSTLRTSIRQTKSGPPSPAISRFTATLTNASLVSVVSGDFSDAVKTRLRTLYYQEGCWVCEQLNIWAEFDLTP